MYLNEDTELFANYYTWMADHNRIPKYYKKYLAHVIGHKNLVYIAWLYIADRLHELGCISEIDIYYICNMVRNHDNSKLERNEFIPYAQRFNGPKQKDPIVKANFKEAVKLHKEQNLHHFEKLESYKGRDWKRYACELICDYIAMGWEFNNYIYEYFQKVKEEMKNTLSKEKYNYIESIINIIPKELPLAEEPLTYDNISYIYYCWDYYNDPFECYDDEEETVNTRK